MSCKQEKETAPEAPKINLVSVYSLNPTQAEAKIELTGIRNNSPKEYGLVWSESPNPTINNNKKTAAANPEDGISTLVLSELQLETTYYVRAYIKLGNDYYYSNNITLSHRGPFIWRSLASINWSDKPNLVSSVAFRSGVIVVRPIDNINTEVWYYFAPGNNWQQQKDLVLQAARFEPLLFKLNKFGDEATYFGGGYQVKENIPGKYIYLKDFWQYDFFSGGTSEEYPDFPFGLANLTHFTLDTRTYVIENSANRSVWMLLNGMSWHKKNDFPGTISERYVGFAAGNKGYILEEDKSATGQTKKLYEYNPDADTWVRKADFPGEDRVNGMAFSVNNKGYYGLGQAKDSPQGFSDIWQYNPTTDSWIKFTDYPGIGHVGVTANTIGNKAYLGLGLRVKASAAGAEEYLPATDFWEVKPD
ncbi:hypothetical protein F0145_07730 [Adhaeribacter rhizoryzae]|uniref:Fibronectin type-III domain-containing protein n=1 Tax=Adhaeribacter rhizoryzae TaxID=2607907 RepID=A0A5M6DJZ0_9BACT|nr:hypothetical protein F0145_07730 [Adhaeribacter rhizoryzae]